jgi:hypothetical protein
MVKVEKYKDVCLHKRQMITRNCYIFGYKRNFKHTCAECGATGYSEGGILQKLTVEENVKNDEILKIERR